MKYCSKCGNQCEDNAGFCDKCGAGFDNREAGPQAQWIQPIQQDYAPPQEGYGQNPGMPPMYPQQTMYQAPMGNTVGLNSYAKIGGWLLFFAILNIIIICNNIWGAYNEISAAVEAMGWFSSGSEIWNALAVNILAQLIVIVAVVFQVLFVVQIFKRKHLFLLFDQISRIIIFVSIICTFVAVGMIGFDNYDGDIVSQMTTPLVSVCVGFFVMPIYYCKSIRVRTYMGSDEYMRKAIYAYKNQPPL